MKHIITISFLVSAVLFFTACEPNIPSINVDTIVDDVLKQEVSLIDEVLNKEFKAQSSQIAIDDEPVFSFIIIKAENERYKLKSKEGYSVFITVKDNKYFIDSEELIIEPDNNRILIGNKVYEGA